MKDKKCLLTYLISLAAGVLLTVFCNEVKLFHILLVILGILILLPGLVAIGSRIRYSLGYGKYRLADYIIVSAVVSVIFGVLLICLPGFFAAYLVYTFAIILMICGVVQIANLWVVTRDSRMRPLYMLVPLLTIGGGIWLACLGFGAVQKTVTLIAGICLIVYSLNGLLGYAVKGVAGEIEEKKRQEIK